MRKKVLITGLSGFVGPHLARILSKSGYRIFGTYCHSKCRVSEAEAEFRVDLRNKRDIGALIERLKPDRIFHLAGQSIPRLSWREPEMTFEVNVAGTLHLLQAVRKSVPAARVLFVSTNLVYGSTARVKKKLAENDVLMPENPYGASKAAAEHACLNFASAHGLDIVIARPFYHLGPGQRPEMVFSDWCRQIALCEAGKKRSELCVGNLDAWRDFLHVEDIVRAYDLLLNRGTKGGIYNICTSRAWVLKKLAEFLLSRSRKPMRIKVETKRLRKDDPFYISGNGAKIKALGWRPQRTPFQALDELLNDWRQKQAL